MEKKWWVYVWLAAEEGKLDICKSEEPLCMTDCLEWIKNKHKEYPDLVQAMFTEYFA